jgi:hypothetical protein
LTCDQGEISFRRKLVDVTVDVRECDVVDTGETDADGIGYVVEDNTDETADNGGSLNI